ncbi:MAG TPA: hypothetical protein VH395_08940 [Jatrophihabitantaceae bacterium]
MKGDATSGDRAHSYQTLAAYIGDQLCRAWGLNPSKVSRIEIHIDPDEPILVRIEYAAEPESLIVDLLKDYDLTNERRSV